MKKSSIPLFIGALLLPYIQVVAVLNFKNLFTINSYIILMILSVILNRFAVNKVVPFSILTANLSVCSFFSLFIASIGEQGYDAKLFNISAEILSVICVIALSVAAWIFLKIFNKAFETKRSKISDNFEEPCINRAGNVLSVISFLLVILSFITAIAVAFIGGSAYNEYIIFYAFIVTVLVLQFLGIIFSYLATSKRCSNYKIALTARFSVFLFLISLGTVALIIISLIEPISRIVQFTILRI